MLKPLQQWVCDSCGEIILAADQGYLEWLTERDEQAGLYRARGLRIVHHAPHSPRFVRGQIGANCYFYEGQAGESDIELSRFVGPAGMTYLIAKFLDVGPELEEEYRGPPVFDMRELVEIMRRLYIPYYEEARLYWDEARADGCFVDSNEVSLYHPDGLRALVERYGGKQK